jgi:hypothetical protein
MHPLVLLDLLLRKLQLALHERLLALPLALLLPDECLMRSLQVVEPLLEGVLDPLELLPTLVLGGLSLLLAMCRFKPEFV